MPLCPNDFCDANFGENVKTCPEDCKRDVGFPVLTILIPILVIGGVFFYLKYRSKIPIFKEKSGDRNQKTNTVKFKYKR